MTASSDRLPSEESAPELHFATVLEQIAAVLGDRPAVVQGRTVRTWGGLDERASRLASVLRTAGLGPDSKVGLYLQNCPEYLEAWLATLKIRGIPVNINYRYVADELEYLLEDSDCEAIVFSERLAEPVASVIDRRDLACALQVGSLEPVVPGAVAYENALAAADPLPPIPRDEADHLLLYTGGTTGLPKGVVYVMGGVVRELAGLVAPFTGSSTPIESGADVVRAACDANTRGASLITLVMPPLMHGTGSSLAQATLLSGGTVVLMDGGVFDPGRALDAIESEAVTVLAVVGDAFVRPLLVEVERRSAAGSPADLSALRLIMSSGAMLSAESKEHLLRLAPGAVVVDTLAASEAPMGAAITTAAGGPATTVFTLRAGTRVITPSGRDVEPGSGEAGRLAVPTDNPIGYYKDAVKTAETFREIDGQRYSLPGDWASVEVDGTIKLLGRGSHCINSAGEKVYPEEVEEALKTHPDVFDALVFGIDDEQWGQRIESVVALREGATAAPDELIGHVKTRLAGYKSPKNVVVVAEVPRAPNGKADYKAARAIASEVGC